MDEKAIKTLDAMNSAFYRTCADSFFATRQNSWPGWKRCMDAIVDDPTSRAGFSLVDLACGNLRFEAFLKDALDTAGIPYNVAVHAIDTHVCTSAELLTRPDDAPSCGRMTVDFKQLDLIAMLIDPNLSAKDDVLGLGSPCDLSVSFGFMHHIPSAALRARFLAMMLELTRPKGYAAISLWRFMSDDRLARRARETTAQALDELAKRDSDASRSLASQLEEGDMLLGWGGVPGRYRYCHDFTGRDVDALIGAVSHRGCPVARFLSDGRNGELNEYIVFRRI